jgi:hypothetical protein
MTERQIARAVSTRLPTAERAPVSQHIQTLKEGEYIDRAGNTGRLKLTDSGERFWRGIRVLAASSQ